MPPVVLFHTCLVNEFSPATGFAVVRVLERVGAEVAVPRDQTCCGQPAFNAGFHDTARAAARHTIHLLEGTTGPIVVPSGSCGDMLIHQYPALFGEPHWQARARAIAARTTEFSAFVAAHRPAFRHLTDSVAYHPSCHLARGLGVDVEPRMLVDQVAGSRSLPISGQDECCGFGGLFAIKHPEISGRMLERKLDAIDAAAPDRVVSCDLGCLLHISGGLHRRGSPIRVQHLAELLDDARP